MYSVSDIYWIDEIKFIVVSEDAFPCYSAYDRETTSCYCSFFMVTMHFHLNNKLIELTGKDW